jgi:hypothetical protein
MLPADSVSAETRSLVRGADGNNVEAVCRLPE